MIGDAPCRVDTVTIVSECLDADVLWRIYLFTRVCIISIDGAPPWLRLASQKRYCTTDVTTACNSAFFFFGYQCLFPAQAVRGFKLDSERAVVASIATGLRFDCLAPKLDSVSPSWLPVSYGR